MDLAADLPVTLVIKAPNQRVGDQTVDCMLGWTVKKLKQHLNSVYPNQPEETSQKLIYSGKLLQDHLTLKEVLMQFDDGSTRHTVHLVCSPPKMDYTDSQTHSRQSSNSSIGETEGLRYRGHHNQSSSTSTSSSSSQSSPTADGSENINNLYSAQFGGMGQGVAQMPGMGQFPPQMMGAGVGGIGLSPEMAMMYTPEQQVWLQQMYAQYMTQYIQFYQQGGYGTPPNTPVTPIVQPGLANQNADRNGRPENEVRMNAGGGAIDDDDDDFEQRDWLDYVYTLCRFMVLMGIVYFYSNFTRFLMVFFFFFIVYVYQMGWFRFYVTPRRRQNANQEAEAGNQEAEAEAERNEEAEQPQGNEAPSSTPENTPAQPQEPAGPGALQVAVTFFTTFFTSLFPQPPPAVNAN